MLCRFLLDTYGLQGTLLIFTGIELNILVFAMLIKPLKPPEYSSKPPHKATRISVDYWESENQADAGKIEMDHACKPEIDNVIFGLFASMYINFFSVLITSLLG
ncbi:uncharacterized protein LOC126809927, partial [Patella vulgata]|uniref:uncharacterized protein LOC126809927 n=1 Tax=Patella vulgata TaxID=6465 RepID=UPI00217F3648